MSFDKETNEIQIGYKVFGDFTKKLSKIPTGKRLSPADLLAVSRTTFRINLAFLLPAELVLRHSLVAS